MDRIADIIRERFGYDGDVTAETVAAEVEGWDSVAHVELIIAIEMEFGIRLTTGETSDLPNVGALVAAVERHVSRRAGSR